MPRRRIGLVGRLGRAALPALALTLLIGLLVACSSEVSVAPPSPADNPAGLRVSQGSAVLKEFATALNHRDAAGVRTVWAAAFVDQLGSVLPNAAKVGLRDLEAEYVDTEPGALDTEELEKYGKDAWVASVRLRYRLADDPGPSAHETAVVFVPGPGGARIAAFGGFGDRTPLWLLGPLQVRRAGQVAIYNASSTSTARLLALGVRAIRDVRRLLPRWRGRLVIEMPRDKESLDLDLAAEPETYANIAAVTTTADGSVVPGAPVHVYVNPQVFVTLRAKGAQVVISHEATHVATRAAFARVPMWLLEGFADYVALDAAGVPVQRAAGQVIARMKKEGLPRGLPTPEDLQPTAVGLGATYEEAWLACRYLGDRWGSAKMVEFYRAVDRGQPVGAAFRSVLGISQRKFVEGWRGDLARLVRGDVAG